MLSANTPDAPGAPGIPPTWSSSAKDTVGTGLRSSRIWFTIGYGIVNEVFYPHVDVPQIRDLGFIVADDNGFWAEVKREQRYTIASPAPGIPAYEIRHDHDRYQLRLRICTDPIRDALLIESDLDSDGLFLYVLLAPHLGNNGHDNYARIEHRAGHSILTATRNENALALVALGEDGRDAFSRASCGYTGFSDGWQDFHHNGRMAWTYPQAGPGNVALLGELPAKARIALAFERDAAGAAALARASCVAPIEHRWNIQQEDWTAWHATVHRRCGWWGSFDASLQDEAQISSMVLKTHEDRVFRGAMVASLSTPWGQSHDDSGGYHLVWTRDLVESALALLAIGAQDEARSLLQYLIATQTDDGHWYQNQWLNGQAFWTGIQLDETAFPILLAAALEERDLLAGCEVREMIQHAASYIARHGPVTEQDRWEEDPGLNPFTLAVCIAALVCAAPFLSDEARMYALELADTWNCHIEPWTYVSDTELARALDVDGYFVRTAPPEALTSRLAMRGSIAIKNRPSAQGEEPISYVVGLEFLQLVRMGLRSAQDQRIQSSVRVADALLKVDTPNGPAWHRYPGDGYGEHADGRPFDGTGHGRAWPLLTGERGHYACAAGEDPVPYLHAMAKMTSTLGMIPEQIWDSNPIPEHMLYPGRPTGSAMPLVWAHAEFIKLCASTWMKRPFDRPELVWKRYGGVVPDPPWASWRFNHKRTTMLARKVLRIEVLEPARVHFSTDGWRTVLDLDTHDTSLGVYVVDLPTATLMPGTHVTFTFYWPKANRWEGVDFDVLVESER
jgi:glucoamylase